MNDQNAERIIELLDGIHYRLLWVCLWLFGIFVGVCK